MAQTKAQKKRAIEGKKRNTVKSGKYKGWHVEVKEMSTNEALLKAREELSKNRIQTSDSKEVIARKKARMNDIALKLAKLHKVKGY